MDKRDAAEAAYKNGFEAGQNHYNIKAELITRIKVAYEQLGKCHTKICRTEPYYKDEELIGDFQDILNALLRLQVKFGILKREEDIR